MKRGVRRSDRNEADQERGCSKSYALKSGRLRRNEPATIIDLVLTVRCNEYVGEYMGSVSFIQRLDSVVNPGISNPNHNDRGRTGQ